MSKREFIRHNRTDIDEWIRLEYALSSINDKDRETYISGSADWKIKASQEGAKFFAQNQGELLQTLSQAQPAEGHNPTWHSF